MTSFASKLEAAMRRSNSIIGLGLDPRQEYFVRQSPSRSDIVSWAKGLVDACSDRVCLVKPNTAYFEALGAAGHEALREILLTVIPSWMPVLLDCKRGDILTTQAMSAKAFSSMCDAVTVSPYVGEDAVKPFLDAGCFVFVLCRTSNPSGEEVQLPNDLFVSVAHLAAAWGDEGKVGFVVGASCEEMALIRHLHSSRIVLAPGVGAQGASLASAVSAANGHHLVLPISRGIASASSPALAAASFADAANAEISKKKKHSSSTSTTPSTTASSFLIAGLRQHCLIRGGDFTLASGAKSSIYVDVRRIISHPSLFHATVYAVANVVSALTFDLIVGVPYGAFALAAAVAFVLKKPFIFLRKEQKTHGTGKLIEGAFRKGQVAVIIEDLVNTGGSTVKVANALRNQELIVKDVVAVVDRNNGGRSLLKENNVALSTLTHLEALLDGNRRSNL